MSAKIVIVQSITHTPNTCQELASIAKEAAEVAGAEVRIFDMAEKTLPVMIYGDPAQKEVPEIQQLRGDAAWADGFILITAEYHGNLAGGMKNWFDFLYPELAGKVAGVIVSTGGGNGDMAATSIRNSFMWCHGWVLPYFAAARSIDFKEGKLLEPKILERVQRIASDVARYAPVLGAAFDESKAAEGAASGFGGYHK